MTADLFVNKREQCNASQNFMACFALLFKRKSSEKSPTRLHLKIYDGCV